MLGKLMKYEFKATGRMILPLYGALIIFAIINRLTFPLLEVGGPISIPAVLAMFVYVFIIIAIFVLTFILMIQRFYKNLFSDEGYLMFTIPVQSWKHILTKLLTSIVWIVVSLIITMISVLILAINMEFISIIPAYYKAIVEHVFNYAGVHAFILGAEGILLMLVGLASSILIIYCSISIGQLFQKHKLLASFGAYLVISTVIQTVGSVIMLILGLSANINEWIINLPPLTLGYTAVNVLLLSTVILSAAMYFIINYIISRKLNLE